MLTELIIASLVITVCGVTISQFTTKARATTPLILIFVLLALGFYNRTLYRTADDPHNGIAGAGPELTTYGIALVIGFFWIACRYRVIPLPITFVPLLCYLLYGTIFIWEPSPLLAGGIIALVLAVAAHGLGFRVAERSKIPPDLGLATVACAILIFQLAASILQLLGFPLVPVSETSAQYLEGRLNGLTPHPNTLGKLVVLMIPLLLLAAPSRKRVFRVISLSGIAVAFVLLALSQGRANFLAAVLLILVWLILRPIGRRGGRGASLLALAVAAFLSGSSFLMDRFSTDPRGGSREHLLDVAEVHIAQYPLWGSGPNTYISVAGQIDAYTAGGLPVHNSFLLSRAELGIMGMVLLWAPILFAFTRALLKIKDPVTGQYAVGQISLLCALVLIGLTGWGLIASWVFPLWLFISGFFSGSLRRTTLAGDESAIGAMPTRTLILASHSRRAQP